MKRTRKIFVLVLAAFLLAGAVWYHIPIKRQLDMTLYSKDGQSLHLEGIVSLHRFFLRLTELRAKVTINGTAYVDEITKLSAYTEPLTLWENLRRKWQGQIIGGYLYPRDLPPMEAVACRFNLIFPQKKVDFSCVAILDEANSIFYYGPAETAETAEEARTLDAQFLSYY